MESINEKNLKLSILETSPVQEGGVLTLRQGAFAGRSFQTRVGACPDPFCPCCNIYLRCRPVSSDGAATTAGLSQDFWLNVDAKKVCRTPKLEQDQATLRLAEAIRAELTDSDWNQLYHWFRLSKYQIIQTMEVSEQNLPQLPDASGGRMVDLLQIFPWGLFLHFSFNQELWAANEQYCVQPKCNCTDTIFTFLKARDATRQKFTSPNPPIAVRYNYHSETTEVKSPGPPGAPNASALLAALKYSHSNLNVQLELRHSLLKLLYSTQLLQAAQAEIKELETQLSSVEPAVSKKVGRNDPCPCGSGKKYKHCCLAKP